LSVFRKRGKWWVSYRDPNGNRRRRPVGPSKREAEAALESIRASIRAGTYFNDHFQLKEQAARAVTLGSSTHRVKNSTSRRR